LKKSDKCQGANTTIFVLVLAVFLILVCLAVIDFGMLYIARERVKSSADFAALSAAAELLFMRDGREAAQRVASENNCILSDYEVRGNVVQVSLRREVSGLFFPKFIGNLRIVEARSAAEFKERWWLDYIDEFSDK
jgi:uncharacterized membrane protein